MQQTFAAIFFLVLSSLIQPTKCFADPDVTWWVQTFRGNNTSNPYPSATEVTSGWGESFPNTLSGVDTMLTFSGSASPGGTSLESIVSATADGTFPGNQNTTPNGLQKVWVKIRAGKTARISVLGTTNAGAVLTNGAGGASAAVADSISQYSGTNSLVSLPGPSGGTTSQSGGGSGTYLDPGNCGGGSGYRSIYLGYASSSANASAYFDGSSYSQGSAIYEAEVGDLSPEAIINGPTIGGLPAQDIEAGATVTLASGSYDLDDIETTPTVGLGICTFAWTITDPDGVISATGSSATFSPHLPKAGPYSVSLTVTDNEGAQEVATKMIEVGAPRNCSLRTPPRKVGACSDKKTSIVQDLFCGNAAVISHDPTMTRGNPLKNEIRINSQPLALPYRQWMGNSSFTYGIQLVFIDSGGGGGLSNPIRMLVDGHGYQYDYGLSTSGSSPKTPGVYPTLSEITGGYLLEGAGSPTEIYKAGNFTYEFDTYGKLLSLTDPNGNEQTISYDIQDRPILVNDASSGRTIAFEYPIGVDTRINKVIENGGFAYREINYDSFDRVTDIITKNNLNVTVRAIAITYDGSGRLATVTKDTDSATAATFSYEDGGHGVSLANISYASGSTNVNYFGAVANGAKYRTKITNNKGGVVSYDYDSTGNLIAVREPTYNGGTAGVVHTYTYDSDRNVLTSSDGTSTRTYTYNSNGLVTREEDAIGRYVEYDYSGVNLIEISDNLGTIAEFDYTDTAVPNSVTAFTDGSGNTWDIDRNSFGQVTAITPPSGSPTGALSFTYDETISSPHYGYLQTITNGAGDVASVDSYTSLGDPTSITTNPASGVTRTVEMTYDATQRETVFEHGDGKTVQTAYTGANATEVTDEAGTLTEYTYCAECNKLTGASGPMSWALSWVLDDDKDVTTFRDALVNDTTYTYGTARELKQITYPDSTTVKYQYDNFGRFKKLINGRNYTATYTFDSSGMVTGDGFYTYTYDNAGQLLTASGSGSVVTYAYTTNRLVSSINYDFSGSSLTNAQKVEYTYNPDQTVDTIIWKNGTTTVAQWDYSYDGAGRVTSVANNFSETTNFTYDGEGKLLTQSNQNGTSREYIYNNQRGWPTAITYKQGSTTTMEYGLTYDGSSNTVGNLTGVTETGGATVSYEYDDLYRLTEETRSTPSYTRTYGYDLAGNPTTINGSSFATFDSANKITQVSGKAVTSDNDGNITSIAATSPLPYKTLEWSHQNKATRVYPTSSGWIDYKYLYDGKRFYSKASSGMTSRVYYIFAGDTLIGEVTTSTPTTAYTWGADGLISKRNLSTSTSHWYEFGPQGETRTLRNSSGTSTDSYYYNAYGEQTSTTGSTVNPYRYGGKYGYYTESYTSLILATQRWYSPQLMRWVSRDPALYDGGVNLFEYVEGDPISWTDPNGQAKIRVLIETAKGIKKLVHMTKENIIKQLRRGKNIQIDEKISSRKKAGKLSKEAWGDVEEHVAHGGRSKHPHYQPKKRKGRKGHIFYSSISVVPGANLGYEICEGMCGDFLNFFNPLSDLNDVALLITGQYEDVSCDDQ